MQLGDVRTRLYRVGDMLRTIAKALDDDNDGQCAGTAFIGAEQLREIDEEIEAIQDAVCP